MINELAAMDSHNFEWVDQQKGTIFHSHASYASLRVWCEWDEYSFLMGIQFLVFSMGPIICKIGLDIPVNDRFNG